MKFRHKPTLVEAVQYRKESTDIDVFKHKGGHNVVQNFLFTADGVCRVDYNDWIITGLNCERYVVKPNKFDELYEQVEE